MTKTGFRIDLAGRRYERLLVLAFAHTSALRQARWFCACTCGAFVVVTGNSLKSGKTRSCGCLRRELLSTRAITHGMSASAEYRIHRGMLNRCYNSKVRRFADYGGRGITVCDRWRFGDGLQDGFACFLADVGMRPGRAHSLERKDNHGPYAPDNVAWATPLEQANNSRRNHIVNVAGLQMTLARAVRSFATVDYSTVSRRMRAGWEAEAAILATHRVSEAEFHASGKGGLF